MFNEHIWRFQAILAQIIFAYFVCRVSFFVFGNLQYSPGITRRHPCAYRWSEYIIVVIYVAYRFWSNKITYAAQYITVRFCTEWYSAHLARFADGAMFLFINTVLMLHAVNMLAIFLNFSALMFLQSIDNVALKTCVDGFWSRPLQECAEDVVELKFAFRQKYVLGCLRGRTTILWVTAVYAILVGFWVNVHFIWWMIP